MVTIKIKENSQQARVLLKFLESLPFVEIQGNSRYNEATEKAIQEAKAGKTTAVSLEGFRKQLYS